MHWHSGHFRSLLLKLDINFEGFPWNWSFTKCKLVKWFAYLCLGLIQCLWMTNHQSVLISVMRNVHRHTHAAPSPHTPSIHPPTEEEEEEEEGTGRSCCTVRSSRSNSSHTHTHCCLSVCLSPPATPPTRSQPPVARLVRGDRPAQRRWVSAGAWLPSRLWSSGAGCSATATEMWPSPTWPLHSGAGWRSVPSYTRTDRTWCEYPAQDEGHNC